MYFAIDNRTGLLIGTHSNHRIICNLAWLHDCSNNAEIIIAPVDDLLAINELSSETLSIYSNSTDRYQMLLEVQSILEVQDEMEVTSYLLEMQCVNRHIDNHNYQYQHNKTQPARI